VGVRKNFVSAAIAPARVEDDGGMIRGGGKGPVKGIRMSGLDMRAAWLIGGSVKAWEWYYLLLSCTVAREEESKSLRYGSQKVWALCHRFLLAEEFPDAPLSAGFLYRQYYNSSAEETGCEETENPAA
jgi:hypothetical protein